MLKLTPDGKYAPIPPILPPIFELPLSVVELKTENKVHHEDGEAILLLGVVPLPILNSI